MGDIMEATFGQRLCAYFIDFIIIFILFFLVTCNMDFTKRNEIYDEMLNNYSEYDPTNLEQSEKLLDLQYQYSKESIPATVISLVVTIGYFVFFQYLNNGQSIGKKLLKIKIVGKDNCKVNIMQIFIRSIFIYQILLSILDLIIIYTLSKTDYLSIYGILTWINSIFIIISALFILYRKDKRGLHDFMAKTYVVNERG